MDVLQNGPIDPLSRLFWNYVLVHPFGGRASGSPCAPARQFRLFRAHAAHDARVPEGADGGISSFQAFAVGLASRVGTGNIAGVAIALTPRRSGRGVLMWMVALLGMATGLVEASLAQYKVRWPDGSFRRSGVHPARARPARAEVVFAVLLVFTFGVAVQHGAGQHDQRRPASAHTVNNKETTAVVLALLTAPIVFGGVRRIAEGGRGGAPRVRRHLRAARAGSSCCSTSPVELPTVPRRSCSRRSALTRRSPVRPAASAAMLNGAKRGLFSNEAGGQRRLTPL